MSLAFFESVKRLFTVQIYSIAWQEVFKVLLTKSVQSGGVMPSLYAASPVLPNNPYRLD
jgi:hypothetical protein